MSAERGETAELQAPADNGDLCKLLLAERDRALQEAADLECELASTRSFLKAALVKRDLLRGLLSAYEIEETVSDER